jgi:hypothetical protein
MDGLLLVAIFATRTAASHETPRTQLAPIVGINTQHEAADSIVARPTSCAAVRARTNPARALLVAKWDRGNMPMMLSAMMDAGFETGVLFERCHHHTSNASTPGICAYDEWEAGQAHGLAFVRATRLLQRTVLIDAVADFRPALVLFVRDVASLVRSAAAHYASAEIKRASRREAASVLRCSLPAERFWAATLLKSEVLRIAAQQGVRTPWSVTLPKQLTPAALEAASLQVPVVIKSDKDGSGSGVVVCRTSLCARTALVRCTKPCGYANCSACTRQQFVVGHTMSFEASAVDGRLLGGFGRAEVLTRGPIGVARASVTLNAPEAAEAMRRLLAHLEYTGVAAADFVIEASTGRAYLIDPNLRTSARLARAADSRAAGQHESTRV